MDSSLRGPHSFHFSMHINSRLSTRVARAPTISATQSSWHRSKIVLRHMLGMSAISNIGAVLCAVVYGVLTPFSAWYVGDARARARAVVGTAALTAFYQVFWGGLSASVLFAFFLRGRYLRVSGRRLTLAQSWRLVVKLTWQRGLLLALLAVGATLGLFAVGVPVVRFNCHSLTGVVCMAIHSLYAISRVARFRQTYTSRNSSLEQSPSLAGDQRARSRRSLSRILCVAMTIVVPQLVAAATGMQFMAVGKSVDVQDQQAVGMFIAWGLVVKFFFQVMVKMLAKKANAASANSRNELYMITSPILIIEIYLRMAALHLGSRGSSKSFYAGTVFVGSIEIVMRLATVIVDRCVVIRQRKKVENMKRAKTTPSRKPEKPAWITFLSRRSAQISPTASAVALAVDQHQHNAELDVDLAVWEANRLRLAAVKIMAGMVAEYCGIGFACAYVVMLRNNPSYDLGRSSQTRLRSLDDWLRFLGSQLSTYAVQLAVEMVSDIVGSSFEMAVGIHVDEVFAKGEVEYIRWTIFVLAIHAGSLSISGFVSTGGSLGV